MANTYKQLAQAQGTGGAASVYSPGTGEQVIIRDVVVVNTTGGDLDFILYCDDDGSTFDETTQILSVTTLPSNSTYERHSWITMNVNAGNIGFDAPSGLTITMWGVVIT